GVGALSDREVGELLVERYRAVDRRATGFELWCAGDGCARADAVDDGTQVRGRRTAAAAHDVEPELVDEAVVRVGERVRSEVVVRVAVDDGGKTRVREAREERAGVLCEIAEVLGHLGGAGRAVEPDDVGSQRLQRGERGTD